MPLIALAATAAARRNAIVQDPGGSEQGSLVSFGPLMDNGFPTSYKDSHARAARGVHHRRRPAVRGSGRAGIYDPDLPLSFPTNFPDEFFYQLASAKLPVNPANAPGSCWSRPTSRARSPPGNRLRPATSMVFARVRIKDVNVPNGTTWRITHPYGVDEITAGANGKTGIVETADVGAIPGQLQRSARRPGRPVPQVGPGRRPCRPRRLHR